MKRSAWFVLVAAVLAAVSVVVVVAVLGVSYYLGQKNEKAELRDFDVPAGWQLKSTEDTLVKGLCLGGGSKCGRISKEYSTASTKEDAFKAASEKLKNQGWDFDTPRSIRDGLQSSAMQNNSRLFMATSDGEARLIYEENH